MSEPTMTSEEIAREAAESTTQPRDAAVHQMAESDGFGCDRCGEWVDRPRREKIDLCTPCRTSPVHTEAAPVADQSTERLCLECGHKERFSDNEGGICEAIMDEDTHPIRCQHRCFFAPVAESAESKSKWAAKVGKHNNNPIMAEVWDNVKKNREAVAESAGGEQRIPVTALYWLKNAKDESYSMPERLFYMENAYNHVVNALLAVPESAQSVTPAGALTHDEFIKIVDGIICSTHGMDYESCCLGGAGIQIIQVLRRVEGRATRPTPAASGVDEAITAVHKVWADTPSSEWYQSKDELTAAWACHNKVVDALTALRGKEK